MILILSGEGPSDIGTCTNGQGLCSGTEFRAGPMAVMVDKIAESVLQYSLADSSALEFVSESALSAMMKELPRTLVIGKKREFETGYFFKGSRALARQAKEDTANDNTPRGVVFFRDADGTCSTERGLYETRVKSMMDGFTSEDFDFGVPMVPKPKSEAWLICALQNPPYQNCAALEESLSGNDNAPEPAKAKLEALLAERNNAVTDLADLVKEGVVDALCPGMMDMHSYHAFHQRLCEVLRAMLSYTP